MGRQRTVSGANDGAGISKGRRRSIQGPPMVASIAMDVHYRLPEDLRRFGQLSHRSRWTSARRYRRETIARTADISYL